MALSKQENQNLQNYIAYLDYHVRQKGFHLYKEGAVSFINHDSNTGIYYFSVKGTSAPQYEVQIDLGGMSMPGLFEEENEAPTYCSCPFFDENSECKHEAAALHFLSANKNANFEQSPTLLGASPESAKQALSFPIIIPWEGEDVDKFYEKIPADPNLRVFDVHLRQVEFLENGLRYHVQSYNYGDVIDLILENGKYRINGLAKRPHLIKTSLKWLQERLAKHPKDLNILTRQQRDEIKTKYLEEMGIISQVNKPLQALDFILQRDQIILVTAGELEGLMNLTVLADHLKDQLKPKDSNKMLDEISIAYPETEVGVYNLGFAIVYDHQFKFKEIVPFMAKGTKKDPKVFSVKFEKVEDPYDLRLAKSENLEKILYQLAKIAKTSSKKTAELLGLFRHFLNLAEGYPVFTFLGSPYESTQVKKHHIGEKLDFQEAKAKLVLSKTGVLYNLDVLLLFGDQSISFLKQRDKVHLTQIFAILDQKILLIFQDTNVLVLLQFLAKYPLQQILEKEFDTFYQQILLPMTKFIDIQDNSGIIQRAEVTVPLQRQLYISELTGLVIFRPQVKYAEAAFSNPLEGNAIIDPDARLVYLRDEDYEEEFVDFLRTLHPNFANAGNQGFFHLTHEAFMNGLWFFKAFEKLKEAQVRVFGLENIKIKKYSPFPPVVSLEFGSSQDWFEVQTAVAFGDQKVKLKDIKKALDQNLDYIELADGSVGILPESWLRKFGKLFRSGDTDKENIKVPKTLFHMLDDFEETRNFPEVLREIEDKKAKLSTFTQIQEATIPKSLRAALRNYQHTGLNWLNFLGEYSWGGILADDMGLGKTLQMIALICKTLDEKKKAKILVIAPTTLLFNWKNELEKFAPEVDYFIHHGARYDSYEDLGKHQVVLTSYGLVVNDLDLLQKIHFDLIVADESQAIKNTQSQRYKAITKLNGKIKMAMTGTPIENSLAELFAQMNFVNPGFFHSFNSFRENYLNPLKSGNKDILAELQSKIKPFVLRRTKEEVLTELPEKTEEYLYCVMGATQRKIYDAYRNEYRDYLLKKIEEEGAENSKMYVLEGLTKLRLACDATSLVSPGEPLQESVKIDLLIEHIVEKTGQHKILVFSQFVKMLDLVQSKLEENVIDYAYLDGSTTIKNREKEVQQFQTDEKKRVFLISLKAGGTGLNLTAADYVYILDPWWNPAVENQAIDRCYRMGQEKHVIAYRMICKDTVEEKIMLLQQAKSKLAKEVISEGDSFLGALNQETMLALFD